MSSGGSRVAASRIAVMIGADSSADRTRVQNGAARLGCPVFL
jgi:hypothetical protein